VFLSLALLFLLFFFLDGFDALAFLDGRLDSSGMSTDGGTEGDSESAVAEGVTVSGSRTLETGARILGLGRIRLGVAERGGDGEEVDVQLVAALPFDLVLVRSSVEPPDVSGLLGALRLGRGVEGPAVGGDTGVGVGKAAGLPV
jgi:hypothetical protein